jgi:polyisoprenoid-binding protein YceI
MKRGILSLALSLGLAALAHAETYELDQAHTEIGFKITHLVINKVHGTFDKFEGKVDYDEKNVEKSSVDVTIDAASIDTRNERRDKHLRSQDFFDADKNPQLTFRSKKVEKNKDAGGLLISGDLTMRGVTKPVVLETTITGKVEAMGHTHIGFEAKTKVNRMDYGIAWNKEVKDGTMMLGDEVEIEISGELAPPMPKK